jgi:uncharacterized coiled-coil protein SlyX
MENWDYDSRIKRLEEKLQNQDQIIINLQKSVNQLTEMMLLCSENFKTLFQQQDQIMKKLENL